MQRTYKTEGVILRRTNYGEADKLLVIYSKHYGKIKVVAKGIRRPTSRKGGNLELFNRVIINLVKGHNLDLITEAVVEDTYKYWRNDLKKVTLAYYFCELIDKLTPEEQANLEVYELITASLGNIGKLNAKVQVRSFEQRLLEQLGFGVPENLKKSPDSLRPYIESIIEKKITSPKILRDLYAK